MAVTKRRVRSGVEVRKSMTSVIHRQLDDQVAKGNEVRDFDRSRTVSNNYSSLQYQWRTLIHSRASHRSKRAKDSQPFDLPLFALKPDMLLDTEDVNGQTFAVSRVMTLPFLTRSVCSPSVGQPTKYPCESHGFYFLVVQTRVDLRTIKTRSVCQV